RARRGGLQASWVDLDAVSRSFRRNDRNYFGATRDDVEPTARDVGPGPRWPGAQQLLRRGSSEVSHAVEVDDSDRAVCRLNAWVYTAEYTRCKAAHRVVVR